MARSQGTLFLQSVIVFIIAGILLIWYFIVRPAQAATQVKTTPAETAPAFVAVGDQATPIKVGTVLATSPILATTPQGATVTQNVVQSSAGAMIQTDVMGPQAPVSPITGKRQNPSADMYALVDQYHAEYGTYDFLDKLTPSESALFAAAGAETL
jgi:hypothetical protein